MFFAIDEEDVDHHGPDHLVLEHVVAGACAYDILENSIKNCQTTSVEKRYHNITMQPSTETQTSCHEAENKERGK